MSELPAHLFLLQIQEVLDTLVNGAPVGQRTTEPTLIDVRHLTPHSFVSHSILGLFLGTDDQHHTVIIHGVTHQIVRLFQTLKSLLKIQNVDPIALREDERLHLRVPATRAMPKVHARFQERLH